MIHMSLFTKQKLTYRLENEFMIMRVRKEGKGTVTEFGINMYTLLYLKWVNNKDL